MEAFLNSDWFLPVLIGCASLAFISMALIVEYVPILWKRFRNWQRCHRCVSYYGCKRWRAAHKDNVKPYCKTHRR